LKSFFKLRGAVVAVSALAVSGCAVGPDFHRPEAPNTDTYTPAALPQQTASAQGIGGAVQRFVAGQDIPGQWWTLFHSEALDSLIRQALADSPNLAAAKATLRQAQENLRAEAGVLLPSVDASLSAQRQKFSGASFGLPGDFNNVFNLYNASVSVSYTLDVFGANRRQVESFQSQVEFEAFQLEAAYLTLTSNIVTTAVQDASLRAQLQATQDIVAALEKQLEVVEGRFKLGAVSRSDVLTQRTALAQQRATLPPLEKQLSQIRTQLSLLAGQLPSRTGIPAFELETLQLPQELPVSLPSSMVRQRPDIRASEALLHAASAQVGVATANLYPQITLTGSYAWEAPRPADLFSPSTAVWSLGGGLVQPLFHGGQLTAKRRAAVAAYDQAAAQYRETVLQAFGNVADTLRALETDARTLKAQAEAEALARETRDLTQKQFELGAVSYLSLLIAQQQYQQTRINLVQAQATRYADTAALFQALGGGWWNRPAQTALTSPAKLN
jgi:NodT family efflux transporter outer membrane factor (OMF) lipoprotein